MEHFFDDAVKKYGYKIQLSKQAKLFLRRKEDSGMNEIKKKSDIRRKRFLMQFRRYLKNYSRSRVL